MQEGQGNGALGEEEVREGRAKGREGEDAGGGQRKEDKEDGEGKGGRGCRRGAREGGEGGMKKEREGQKKGAIRGALMVPTSTSSELVIQGRASGGLRDTAGPRITRMRRPSGVALGPFPEATPPPIPDVAIRFDHRHVIVC